MAELRPVPHVVTRSVVPRFVVVVPAHNEATLLPLCLNALVAARDYSGFSVRIVVVLDGCSDNSVDVVPAGIDVLHVEERNVGAARAAGFAHLERNSDADLWFATTDADSVVDIDWFDTLAAYADSADVVAGVVRVPTWNHHGEETARLYEELYSGTGTGITEADEHGHIHGANMAVRAQSYWAVGGFDSMSLHEDVDIVRRLSEGGFRVAWARDVRVSTSDRIQARVSGGFADHLVTLDAMSTEAS